MKATTEHIEPKVIGKTMIEIADDAEGESSLYRAKSDTNGHHMSGSCGSPRTTQVWQAKGWGLTNEDGSPRSSNECSTYASEGAHDGASDGQITGSDHDSSRDW